MDPGYAARYRELHARHWWWRSREALVLEELDRQEPEGGWGRVLDVGCGGGVLFDRLLERARSVEGIEPDEALVDPGGAHAERIHVGPFDGGFDPAEPFDLVLMLDVLEHMDRRPEALARVRSILRPGGRLLLTVPALPLLWTSHDELNRHRVRYTRRALAEEAVGAGLRVRDLRYFFYWTVGGKLVQRGLEAVAGRRPAPPRVPPPPLNRILEGLSRADARLGRWLRLPFGSSLLLVADRV